MSSDWAFILVFYPSAVALVAIWVFTDTENERVKFYNIGRRHGYEDGFKEGLNACRQRATELIHSIELTAEEEND